jgi:NADPH-dependent 2,4-dienoyl-CoA reductase/sulfur reductase-like enzyme
LSIPIIAVVVGGSFIGTEVAAYLAGKAASVTLISRTQYLLERTLGPRVGNIIQALHEGKGVKVVSNSEVEAFLPCDSQATSVGLVKLKGAEEPLEADVVVLGIGVVPATGYLEKLCDADGCVSVNEFLQVPDWPEIFACGDIARFPLSLGSLPPQKVCIGHWQLAQSHGRTAGLNIAQDQPQAVQTVPFFWTVQYGKSIRYAGYAPTFDDVLLDQTEEGSFVAYFCQGAQVLAVATLGRDPVAADFANLLSSGVVLAKDQCLSPWQRAQ